MKIILASTSPRRRELFHLVTDDFEVIPSFAEEVSDEVCGEKLVYFLAKLKADSVFATHSESVVVGCDTVVVLDNKVLGKPHSKEEAYEMLSSLSGRLHEVYTGVCIESADKIERFCARTSVLLRTLSDKDIFDYIATGSPFDKAGAYGIQDTDFVVKFIGSKYNVMGLPVEELKQRIQKFNI